jgi:hypothetical protein
MVLVWFIQYICCRWEICFRISGIKEVLVSRVQVSKLRPAQIKIMIHFLVIEWVRPAEIIDNPIASQELSEAKETQADHFHHIPNFCYGAIRAMPLEATEPRL